MKRADFTALDRWAAKLAEERGEPTGEVHVVAFDEPRLVGIRSHYWRDGNVVHVSGLDYAWFATKAIADVFAGMKTFRGQPAKAVRA